jgi:prepilin peptidase CpaA
LLVEPLRKPVMTERFIFNVFLVGFTSFAAVCDLKENKIPNKLILVGLAGGLLFSAFRGVPQLFDSGLGCLVGIGVLLIPFALGWMGAGDVKFLGALGAILGIQWLPRILFYCAIFGGVLAVSSLVVRRRGSDLAFFKKAWEGLQRLASRIGVPTESVADKALKKTVGTVPYGVAIGMGALVAFYLDPHGEWAGF